MSIEEKTCQRYTKPQDKYIKVRHIETNTILTFHNTPEDMRRFGEYEGDVFILLKVNDGKMIELSKETYD